MSIKLIAIDIDGTLINDQLEITEKTKETLQKATAQGIKVVLCTGRPMTGVHKYLDQLGINNLADQYVISFNGALAQTTSGQVISQFTLPFEKLVDLSAVALKADVHLLAETADAMYVLNQDISSYAVYESSLVSLPITYKSIDQLNTIKNDLVISKLMITDEPAAIDGFSAKLTAPIKRAFNIVRSEPYYLEFVNPSASKGAALASLGQELGVARTEMMAIGNAQNDESMITYAGIGVAMSNSIPSTIQLADELVADNNHDGVAEAVEKFALASTTTD
ncbi:Cof-type HAD-IIB family hydrolase [Limosilactobacillus fermentum]|nr:Cof-type HAD-IIB family hydrolase [Limosilactobacillus fermentum]MBN2933393.1 Cof-type HAD-IIB family hydrolase [Limosilactobacillus fermentum]MCZ2327386.1 Cof-type HAD-IIB family hydrolase [Limosilactobacillus fermentum]WLW44710.1 Cof-type HAD-IIB family hydrolase [Limosilactobacillus fermentum]